MTAGGRQPQLVSQINELLIQVTGLARDLQNVLPRLARIEDFLYSGADTVKERLKAGDLEHVALRQALAEHQRATREDFAELRREIEATAEKRTELEAIEKAGRWSFKAAIWPAIIGLAAAAGTAIGWLIEHLWSKRSGP